MRKFILFNLYIVASFIFVHAQKSAIVVPTNPAFIWAVDDYVLSQKKGEHPMPDVKPEYEHGKQALYDYFAEENFDSDKTFTISIGFLVNSKGQAGNFEVLTKHSPENQQIVEEVLAITKYLPSFWLPAKVNGRYVDCYQVLNIMVHNGDVVKVGLK